MFCGSDFHDLVKLKLKFRANANAITTTTVAAIIHINKKSTNLKKQCIVAWIIAMGPGIIEIRTQTTDHVSLILQ